MRQLVPIIAAFTIGIPSVAPAKDIVVSCETNRQLPKSIPLRHTRADIEGIAWRVSGYRKDEWRVYSVCVHVGDKPTWEAVLHSLVSLHPGFPAFHFIVSIDDSTDAVETLLLH